MARNVARTSDAVTPGATCRARIRRRPRRAPLRFPVHGRVLADLERGEVEAERLDLPAEVLEAPVREALETVRDQGLPQLLELEEQLVRAGVAPARRPAELGKVGARPAKALGNRSESAAIRLVREAGRSSRASMSGRSSSSTASRRTIGRGERTAGPRPRRQRRHEPGRDRLVAVEKVVGLDRGTPHVGRLGGHVRVPVAIAADPGAPGEERGRGGGRVPVRP